MFPSESGVGGGAADAATVGRRGVDGETILAVGALRCGTVCHIKPAVTLIRSGGCGAADQLHARLQIAVWRQLWGQRRLAARLPDQVGDNLAGRGR